MHLFTCLFNLYGEAILRQLEDLPAFITGEHDIVSYADITVFLFVTAVINSRQGNEGKKKKQGLGINCKKTEYMILRNRDGLRMSKLGKSMLSKYRN